MLLCSCECAANALCLILCSVTEALMKRRSLSVVMGLSLLFLAGGPASASRNQVGAVAVRAADQSWARAFGAKDLDKSVGYCAPDGSMLPPNAHIATGRDAIRALLTGLFSLPSFKISWTPSKVGIAKSGDIGYTSGAYQLSFNDPNGKAVSDTGKYVTIWKKQPDGSWKVYLDIFNSDMPPPAAPGK